jgi:hypothetical protein
MYSLRGYHTFTQAFTAYEPYFWREPKNGLLFSVQLIARIGLADDDLP